MSKRILVVDDDFDDLKAMEELLQKNGFETKAVTNGADAIDSFKENAFDLILIDIKMPTLSGYDLLRLMREKVNGKAKMVFVSIVPKQEVDMKGINGFVQKPFSAETFLAEVKKALGE